MKKLVFLLLLLSACESDSDDSGSSGPPPTNTAIGVANADAASYDVSVWTTDSTNWPPVTTETPLLTVGPASSQSASIWLEPSSATVKHYIWIRDAASDLFLDASTEFNRPSGGVVLIYVLIQSGTVYWSDSPSGPWN